MNIKEFNEMTNNILANLNDQGKVSEYLNKLNDAYKTTKTTNESLQEDHKKQSEQIDALKQTNMDLFLKMQTPQEQHEDKQENDEPQLKYDDLIQDLGGK